MHNAPIFTSLTQPIITAIIAHSVEIVFFSFFFYVWPARTFFREKQVTHTHTHGVLQNDIKVSESGD